MTYPANRRRFERYMADELDGEFSYSVEANVLNLSIGGIAVRTQTAMSIGRRYRFRLGQGSTLVDLAGTVRWCRLAGTEKQETGDVLPVYQAGIAFDDVLSDNTEELIVFMEKNVIVEIKRRLFGRFEVEENNTVRLDSEGKFQVKQISMAGMMIETDVALEPDVSFAFDMRLSRRKFASRARVVYVSETTTEGEETRYRMGLEFMPLTSAQQEILEGFMRTELKRGEQKSTES